MLQLKPPFKNAWAHSDPYQQMLALQGETFRVVEARRTLRFDFNGESYFVKYHRGMELKEVLKNLITLRLPVFGARNEWLAIRHLRHHGITTMTEYAFAERNCNPLRRESFIITKDLNPAISLEDYCADWAVNPPDYGLKRRFIRALATAVGGMHRSGLNHRDCYLCHFLLAQPFSAQQDEIKLAVIDLHRAQIRRKVPLRWRNKDLIGLYYSSLGLNLSVRDYLYFLSHYFGQTPGWVLKHEKQLIRQSTAKAEKIKAHTLKKNL